MSGNHHFDEEIYALDAQINRLALACGIDVSDKDTLVALIRGEYAPCERSGKPVHEELRGLLMLRYKIEAGCINALDADRCMALLDAEASRLRNHGLRVPAGNAPQSGTAPSGQGA